MWLVVGNVNSKITRATDEERSWLSGYLTFDGKRRGAQEGPTTCLLNQFSLTYPSGFNSMIARAASEEGVAVEWIDKRVPPCQIDKTADLAWLRDYQIKGVMRAAEKVRGILKLPTGSGKSELLVGLTRVLPCRWLALVHRSQLADDIASRFELRSNGLAAGRILEGQWDVPDEDPPLIAATYQSLRAALNSKHRFRRERAHHLLEEAEGLIVDEVHTAPSETYLDLLMKTRSAYFRIGLSGTPLDRGDAKSQYAIAAIGPIIYEIKPQLLIGRGVLAKPTVHMARVAQHRSTNSSWAGVYRELVVRSKVRNAKLVKYAVKCTKPGFLFVEQKEHGHALVKMLYAAGLKAEFVWGTHSIDYRKSLIRRLVKGHFDLLVCSRVFNEGIDVVELRSCINGGGGKSIISTLQRLGRGMRVDRDKDGSVREGGDVFEVYDILDEGQRWLEKHAEIRKETYLGEGHSLIIDEPTASDELKRRKGKA